MSEVPTEPVDPAQPEAAGPRLGQAKWAVGAGVLAATLLGLKAAGVGLWSWTVHALVLVLATQFLARGTREEEPEQPTKLLRGAVVRGIVGALLCLAVLEFSIWVTSRELFPAYRPAFAQGFAALTGLGWGAVWLVEALFRRRPATPSRDLLGGGVAGAVGFLLAAYAKVQTLYFGGLLEGEVAIKEALRTARDLVSSSGADELSLFLALSIPIATTTLGRLRGLGLAAQLGLSILGTSALSGLLLSPAFVTYPRRFLAGLVGASLLSLLVPLLWRLLDRLLLAFSRRRAADEAMDEVLRVDQIRRPGD